jgi:hypothetical protein
VRRRTPVREAQRIVSRVRRRQYLLDLGFLLLLLVLCLTFWATVGYLLWLLVVD